MKNLTLSSVVGVIFTAYGIIILCRGHFHGRGYEFTGNHAYAIGVVCLIIGAFFLKEWLVKKR